MSQSSYLSQEYESIKKEWKQILFDSAAFVVVKKSGEGKLDIAKTDLIDFVTFSGGDIILDLIQQMKKTQIESPLWELVFKSGSISLGMMISRYLLSRFLKFGSPMSWKASLYNIPEVAISLMASDFTEFKILPYYGYSLDVQSGKQKLMDLTPGLSPLA